MPTVLQFRRGTTTQNNNFTGSAGELSIDTTLDTVRVHDGSTAGGFALTQNAASQTLTNKTLTSPQINTQVDMLARAELRFQDATGGEFVALEAPATVASSVTFTLPAADGSSGQALITDGSGAMSFGAAGATVTSDTSTNAERLIYVGSITSGALTAVTQDSGLTYNPSSGSLTSATFIGALTGNASGSAATLATARAIALSGDVVGTADFDGSAGISISTTIQANSVALGTDTTGNYVAAGAVSGTGLSGSASAEGATFTVTSNATNANTGSTIVARDGSGDFSAGVITATATQARYADLAEKYTSDADYEPGTVVELGGTAEVTQTTRPWSPTIAGIVSTDPAYLMNNDLDGISVALIGRVPCKVVGPVRKGEFLVSSRTPGHAEAHKDLHGPPAGSAIGKAIEDKDSEGTGVIEVLVGRM
tara:strand:- start:4401 stop:5672 length:1272 start_codon:yes stop_codon:yes gene_type:complete